LGQQHRQCFSIPSLARLFHFGAQRAQRQQIVVGTAIMTFLVVIITTVSNWNP